MSSTTGMQSGNLLGEIARLRTLLERGRRSRRALAHSRDYWKQRALAAEWGLRQLERRTGGHQMTVQECIDETRRAA